MISGNESVQEGDNITLECRTNDPNQELTVSWFNYKDELLVSSSETVARYRMENLCRNSSGNNTCKAFYGTKGKYVMQSTFISVSCE